MSLALFKVSVTAAFAWGACARTFHNSDLDVVERMSSASVRESLFAELKHAVTHDPGETKLLGLGGVFEAHVRCPAEEQFRIWEVRTSRLACKRLRAKCKNRECFASSQRPEGPCAELPGKHGREGTGGSRLRFASLCRVGRFS